MSGKLIFTEHQGKLLSLLYDNNRLLSAYAYDQKELYSIHVGAIYIGIVRKVQHNIGACFVEIAPDEICFLPLSECGAAFLINRTNEGAIREGDEIVVQVNREATKSKQPCVTTKISISGTLLVICAGNSKANASTKLSSKQRTRLFDYFKAADIIDEDLSILSQQKVSELPPFGLILRTMAAEVEDQTPLLNEYNILRQELITLYQKAVHSPVFSCLLKAPSPYQVTLKQIAANEYDEIITDSPSLYNELSAYVSTISWSSPPSVRLYQDTEYSLAKLYSIETRLQEALSTRVWLKSGGYLVIEPTEALTVIDVNSGRYQGKKKNSDAYFAVNLEAADEIVRQIRLRNISGIIIVDFINMSEAKHQEELLKHLEQLVRYDRIKMQVVGMTALGLVEITRRRLNKTLAEQLKK